MTTAGTGAGSGPKPGRKPSQSALRFCSRSRLSSLKVPQASLWTSITIKPDFQQPVRHESVGLFTHL
jgi:hypothetical protein